MNSTYHQPDMAQTMPIASTGGYAPAAMAYQQQQPSQHHHHQPPARHQPPQQLSHSHQHSYTHQHQHQHPLSHPSTSSHHLPHHSQHPHPGSHSHHSSPAQPLQDQHHQQQHHQHNSHPHPHPHHQQPLMQNSKAEETAATISSEDQGTSDAMTPLSKVDEATGRKYYLDVVQQPRRARMCGFGDKDRRPITPPPCVRLVITDIVTGKEIDCNEIDHSMFVLNVDLWSEDGKREVNLVRSSSGNPAISSTTPFSYSTLNGAEAPAAPFGQQGLPPGRDPAYNPSLAVGYVQDYQVQPGYGHQVTPSYPPNGSYGPPQQYFPQHQAYRADAGVSPVPTQANAAQFGRNGTSPAYGQDQNALARMAMVGGQPQGMFTRNLIGSLAASAFRLSDTADRIGIWFVLQDLSVRTEGPFRLRFSFVNVGQRSGAPRDPDAPKVNTGRAPILASCFSEPFMVFSAKKFPGVCESTPLSKTFAAQGIKIPIRKDANSKGGDDDDYGEL